MGNKSFNENTRVQVPAALHLCKLGYNYLDNINAYDTKTNILVDIFLNAVKRLNPDMSSQDASSLFSKIVNIANNDDLGREFYQLLSSNSGIKLIDFDNPDNNDWHVTTEFTCENEDTEDNITAEEFYKRMSDYKDTLTAQFEESHRLESEILRQLDSINFNDNAKKE